MLIRFKIASTGDEIGINPSAVSSVGEYGFGDVNKAKIHMINSDTHYVMGSIDEVTNTMNDTIEGKRAPKPKTNPTPIRTAAKRK